MSSRTFQGWIPDCHLGSPSLPCSLFPCTSRPACWVCWETRTTRSLAWPEIPGAGEFSGPVLPACHGYWGCPSPVPNLFLASTD